MEDDENSTVHLACTSLHPEGLSPLTMDLDEDLRALVAKLELGRADPARNSKILIDRLVAHAGHRALIFASPELRDDKTYILQHVKVNGRRLKFASKALKDDREIVKAAINTYGGALEWASPRLRRDPDLVWSAVMSHGCAMHHVPRRMREQPDFILGVRRGDMRRGLFPKRGGDSHALALSLHSIRKWTLDDGFSYEDLAKAPKVVTGKSVSSRELWLSGGRHGRLEGWGGWLPPVGGAVKGFPNW
jgi:hypothetical protein